MTRFNFISSILLLSGCFPVVANELPDSLEVDSVPTHKKNIIERVIAYFDDSNKPHEEKPFDFSIIGGPHYSSDTKFGIGLVAAGLYRTAHDSINPTPQSNVTLYSDVSTAGFYMLGVRGTNIMPRDRMRVVYDFYFYYFLTKFWGIGYDMERNNSNSSKFNELQVTGTASLLIKLGKDFYAGPMVHVNYDKASRVRRPELWDGQPMHVLSPGAGITAEYDTRDNLNSPWRGWLIELSQLFYPHFFGNSLPITASEVAVNFYHPLWRGGVIAARVHSRYAYGTLVPWCMLSKLGDGASMRGYYKGRYRDRFEADVTVELRQKVWRRSGAVLWLGAGTVAPDPGKVKFRHILPNVGVGYRWEFKERTNVRLDLGFGRGEWGFEFNICEAF